MTRKTLLYRLFKVGRIPAKEVVAIEPEGLVALDEGIKGKLRWRNYRAPGRYASKKVTLFTGSIAVTARRLLAYVGRRRAVDVAYDSPEYAAYDLALDGSGCLVIIVDVSQLDDKQSGTIEYCYFTDQAEYILDEIRASADLSCGQS